MACSGVIRLSGIGFGTWAWGNQLVWGYDPARDDPRLSRTFRCAIDAGLTLIDTADSYGTGRLNGRSEALLGTFVEALPPAMRSRPRIATKLAPFPWRLGRRGMDRAFKASHERLKGHLRRVQLHWSTARYAPWQEEALLDGLADLVLAGRVQELGVSNVGPQNLARIHKRLMQRGVRLSSVQIQFSLLAPGDLRLHQLLDQARDLDVQVLAYSPLAFGILCVAPEQELTSTTQLRKRLNQRLLPASRQLREGIQAIASDRCVSAVQVALNWCRAHGTTPIPGIRTPEQATDVAGALGWCLSDQERTSLDRLRRACDKRMPSNPFQSD